MCKIDHCTGDNQSGSDCRSDPVLRRISTGYAGLIRSCIGLVLVVSCDPKAPSSASRGLVQVRQRKGFHAYATDSRPSGAWSPNVADRKRQQTVLNLKHHVCTFSGLFGQDRPFFVGSVGITTAVCQDRTAPFFLTV